MLHGPQQPANEIILVNRLIPMKRAIPTNEPVQVHVVHRPHYDVDRMPMKRVRERRKLPSPYVPGQKQHALAPRQRPLVILKTVVDDDFVYVLNAVLWKLANLSQLPPQ